MSLVITLYVREGIVMGSDSRLTLNTTQQQPGQQQIVNVAVGQSDTVYKIFLTPNNVGISTYGAADVQGVPIAGFIESFINEHLTQGNFNVDNIPQELLNYFRNLTNPPATQFHVAGYTLVNNIPEQRVWHVDINGNATNRLNPPGQQGAAWGGEADILSRLIQPIRIRDASGNFQDLPSYPIQWGFFTLQDAIDYAIYAIRSTIDSIRFQPRPKTVGGPIDVLVIKPNEAFWIQRKVLHGQ